jgi:hypothetical protein
VNGSTLRWKWQGSKDIPQVSQALGTLGVTITFAKLIDIIYFIQKPTHALLFLHTLIFTFKTPQLLKMSVKTRY